MKEIILLKNGELALKGLNRHTFENQLIKNMKLFIQYFRSSFMRQEDHDKKEILN